VTFGKLADPIACPGAYDLTLYCDHENDEHPRRDYHVQIIGETASECRRIARKQGWKLHADNYATCPRCIARAKRG
jgi:hypothetical protein